MKTLAACALTGLATLVLLSGAAPAQDPASLVQRVTALEEEVAALRKRLTEEPTGGEEAVLEVARMRESLNATLTYLHARSVADKKLAAELDRVEALGFTAGINGASRETLLAGMRAHLAASATGLPAPAARKDAAGEADTTRR